MYILLGAILILLVVLALRAWYGAKARQGSAPPEISRPQPSAPEDRPHEWDPRDRYE